MTLLVPYSAQVLFLQRILTEDCKLKLFSNDHTPGQTDTVASLTEVSGGGYAEITLTFANWTITEGDPSVAVYTDFQDWNFTGTTSGPGTIYGYYITDDGETELLWEERFDPADVPFTPISGSLVRVKPRITSDSV